MHLFNYLYLSTYIPMTLYVIYPRICVPVYVTMYLSSVYFHVYVSLCLSIYLSIISVSLIHPSVQRVMEPRTFWGESWLGPSVKLLQGERCSLSTLLEASLAQGPEAAQGCAL